MVADQAAAPACAGIPNSPHDLIAMQNNRAERPEKPERQQIALFLMRRLENFHDQVVGEMKEDDDAKHSQIVSWTIDADRLYRARTLLESVDLE
jgi:hypothetical protein